MILARMALGFAMRVLEDKPEAGRDERLRYAFRRALAREPDGQELDVLRNLLIGELARLTDADDARATPLTLQEVLASVDTHHPLLRAEMFNVRAGRCPSAPPHASLWSCLQPAASAPHARKSIPRLPSSHLAGRPRFQPAPGF